MSFILYWSWGRGICILLFDTLGPCLRPAARKEHSESSTAGKAFKLCTETGDQEWFTLRDILHRYSLVNIGWCWALLTNPLSFPIYTFKFNWLWYGYIQGTLLSLCLPFMPVAMVLMEFYKTIKSFWEVDWMLEGPGRVFFIRPEGRVKSFLWSCYLCQSMFIGQFFLVGTNDHAI